MIHKQVGKIRWLEFELFEECPIIHGCLMRERKSSFKTYVNCDSNSEGINFEEVSHAMKISQIISAKLSHGSCVISVPIETKIEALNYDGLSTNRNSFGLLVTQADCQAAIFYDPILHILANVHCGWRGSVQNIYKNTIIHLSDKYRSKAENILVGISPSLGPENSQFLNYEKELPRSFWDFQIRPNYFDLWEISRWQLLEAGILPGHIQCANIDTFANPQDFFSYRYSKTSSRQATVCSLK